MLGPNTVRSSRPCPKCRVEVQPESRIELQVVALDSGDVHFMVALGMYFASAVLVEEIIGDHQTAVVARQGDVMRAGLFAEVKRLE